ncbi:MAG: NADH:flavin oxidoreductase [bacterium]|nr:NADH:flavin oxidoreductase [bacterium]
MKNNIIFTPKSINGLELKNRFIRSATHNNTSDLQGYPTTQTKLVLENLAEGNVALIITGAASVSMCNGYYIMNDDKYITPWKEITDSVHKKGSLIAMQIFHPGRQEKIADNKTIIAPSALSFAQGKPTPKAMTVNEIKNITNAFVISCHRAKKAGFDAVQIHVAHGYLLSSFISPASNIRTDNYGGNTINRTRILVDIIKRTRELLGEKYPILLKLNIIDGLHNGLESIEGFKVAKILADAGIDAIEISGGTMINPEIPLKKVNNINDEGYFKDYASALKKELDIPVILVGGHRTLNAIENIVKSGHADYISLCRPLICEPNLIKRWQKDDKSPAKCISCNKCLYKLISGKQALCILNKTN